MSSAPKNSSTSPSASSRTNLLLVLGEYIWQREVIPPEAQWQWGVECVQELGQYAGEAGIDIALELEPFRLSLLNSIPKMVQFVNDCALPNVKANIDIQPTWC